jgi:hypothetical protein
LTKFCELDLKNMDPSEAMKIEQLLNESRLSQVSSTLESKSRDAFNYKIEIEKNGQVNTFNLAESAVPETAIQFIEYLSNRSVIRKLR